MDGLMDGRTNEQTNELTNELRYERSCDRRYMRTNELSKQENEHASGRINVRQDGQPITRRQNFRLVRTEPNCRGHFRVHLKWKISTCTI